MGAAVGIGVRRDESLNRVKILPQSKRARRDRRESERKARIVTLGASATLTAFGLTWRRHYGLRRCIRRGQALCRAARA
jgi:hypothetical protein